MKGIILLLAFVLIGCHQPQNEHETCIHIIDKQQTKIDSLQALYDDCDTQARIMAKALE